MVMRFYKAISFSLFFLMSRFRRWKRSAFLIATTRLAFFLAAACLREFSNQEAGNKVASSIESWPGLRLFRDMYSCNIMPFPGFTQPSLHWTAWRIALGWFHLSSTVVVFGSWNCGKMRISFSLKCHHFILVIVAHLSQLSVSRANPNVRASLASDGGVLYFRTDSVAAAEQACSRAVSRQILSTMVVSDEVTCAFSNARADNDEILRFSILQCLDPIAISIVIAESSMTRMLAPFAFDGNVQVSIDNQNVFTGYIRRLLVQYASEDVFHYRTAPYLRRVRRKEVDLLSINHHRYLNQAVALTLDFHYWNESMLPLRHFSLFWSFRGRWTCIHLRYPSTWLHSSPCNVQTSILRCLRAPASSRVLPVSVSMFEVTRRECFRPSLFSRHSPSIVSPSTFLLLSITFSILVSAIMYACVMCARFERVSRRI